MQWILAGMEEKQPEDLILGKILRAVIEQEQATMNKSDSDFCPICFHHLYMPFGDKIILWCQECGRVVDDPATAEDVQPLREPQLAGDGSEEQ